MVSTLTFKMHVLWRLIIISSDFMVHCQIKFCFISAYIHDSLYHCVLKLLIIIEITEVKTRVTYQLVTTMVIYGLYCHWSTCNNQSGSVMQRTLKQHCTFLPVSMVCWHETNYFFKIKMGFFNDNAHLIWQTLHSVNVGFRARYLLMRTYTQSTSDQHNLYYYITTILYCTV